MKPSPETIRRILFYDHLTGQFYWKCKLSNRKNIGSQAGTLSTGGYIRIGILNKQYAAHRLAFVIMNGDWPTDDVDHIDGNRINNAWSNLRLASDQINAQNLHSAKSNNKSSGLLGAYFNKRANRWFSMIRIGGKNRYLGLFDTPEQAHAEYINQKRKHHAGCTI